MTNLTFALPTTLLGVLAFLNSPSAQPEPFEPVPIGAVPIEAVATALAHGALAQETLAGVAAQARTNRAATQEPEAPEVSVAYFEPRSMDPNRLANLAQRLIYSSGVLGEIPNTMFQPVTFESLEKTILVAAQSTLMPDVLGLLRDLDDGNTQAQKSSGDEATRVTTYQYRLRFASSSAVESVLRPFMNVRLLGAQGHQMPDAPTGITIEYETGTVVVRETTAMIAEIRRVIEQIDQPEPQVRMTYYLVRGVDDAVMEAEGIDAEDLDAGLPKDLVRDLGALLPVRGFQPLSFGVLQGDALSPRDIRDTMATGATMSLTMSPTTYDRETGTLGVDDIRFEYAEGGYGTKRFTTSAQLEPGRFTVLGGVGATPIFLVLHMQRM